MRADEVASGPSSLEHHRHHARHDNEPCSTDSTSATTANAQSPFLRLQLQSGHIDSPLRQVLSSRATPTSIGPSSSSTPLLKASLNSPPVAHASRSASSSPSSSSTSPLSIACQNGSMDLSLQSRTRGNASSLPQPSEKKSPADMYSTLLLQLRQSAFSPSPPLDAPFPVSPSSTSPPSTKLTAAARKERLKAQPCFQCPVCKKRFQRHIAMNAHYQTEHIGQVQSGEKICRLCSHKAKSMVDIRIHLVKEHRINLDSPTSCLAEPETTNNNNGNPSTSAAVIVKLESGKCSSPGTTTTTSSVLHGSTSITIAKPPKFRSSLRSGSPSVIESAISDRESSNSESSGVSVTSSPRDKSPPHLIDSGIKKEPNEGSAEDTARDLSVRGSPLLSFHDKTGSVVITATKRPSSPGSNRGGSCKKKKMTGRLAQEPLTSAQPSFDPQWRCQHCAIIFPNQTLYFLHRGFHSEGDPWRCNSCRLVCSDMYDFNTHLVSYSHN